MCVIGVTLFEPHLQVQPAATREVQLVPLGVRHPPTRLGHDHHPGGVVPDLLAVPLYTSPIKPLSITPARKQCQPAALSVTPGRLTSGGKRMYAPASPRASAPYLHCESSRSAAAVMPSRSACHHDSIMHIVHRTSLMHPSRVIHHASCIVHRSCIPHVSSIMHHASYMHRHASSLKGSGGGPRVPLVA